MPVVVALFEQAEVGKAAESAIGQAFGRSGGCLTQRYTRAPLDGNMLPEGATEFGRNIAIAMAAGGLFMATAGGIAGGFDLMLGMGIGMGIALGFITGLLMGLVGAMQAGTRVPKPAVRALESRLIPGTAIVVVEIEAARIDEVTEMLEHQGAIAALTC